MGDPQRPDPQDPCGRISNHARADRIEDGVAPHLVQIILLVDENPLVAALEKMPNALVSLVEDANVFAVQPMHPLGERAERRLDDEMVVIRHQAILVETPSEPFHRGGE